MSLLFPGCFLGNTLDAKIMPDTSESQTLKTIGLIFANRNRKLYHLHIMTSYKKFIYYVTVKFCYFGADEFSEGKYCVCFIDEHF